MKRALCLLLLALALPGCGGSAPSGGAASRPERPSVAARFSPGTPFPVLFRRSTGRWFLLYDYDATGPLADRQVTYGGNPTDLPLAGDWDGDGTLDVGLYRQVDGRFYLLTAFDASGPGTDVQFDGGVPGRGVPVVGQFSGPGTDLPGVYDPATGRWRLALSLGPGGPGALQEVTFGDGPTSLPVVGDFDGDGQADLATWRPDLGRWRLDFGRDGTADATFDYGGDPTDRPLAGDWDGDGRDDPAVYRASTGRWYLLTEWTPAGPQVTTEVLYGGDPTDVPVVGDFNQDGTDDPGLYRRGNGQWHLLTERNGSQVVSELLLSYGADSSDQPVTAAPALLLPDPVQGRSYPQLLTSPSGASPTEVRLGSFDGQAPLDAVVALAGAYAVGVQAGNGDGTFQAPRVTLLNATPRSLQLGDLDGDGQQDAVAALSATGQVAVLRGRGDGTLQRLPYAALSGGPRDVALADLDGDTRLDAVAALSARNGVAVLRGRGDGTFEDAVDYGSEIPSNDTPSDLAVADFTGDGDLDVAVLAEFGRLYLLAGAGDGTLGPAVAVATGITGLSIGYDLAAGDLDEDTVPDLVLHGLASSGGIQTDLHVLPGLPGGGFGAPLSVAAVRAPTSLDVADVDGDGHLDVTVSSNSSTRLCRGSGDGSLSPGAWWAGAASPYSSGTAAGDVTGDGVGDLVRAGGTRGVLATLPGLGSGEFSAPRDLVESFDSKGSLNSAVASDLDGDGRGDVLSAGVNGVDLGSGSKGWVRLRFGEPGGQYSDLPLFQTYMGNYGKVALGDFDGDGRRDFAAWMCTSSLAGAGFLSAFLNQGNRQFVLQAGSTFPGNTTNGVASGDFNEDGRTDLAIGEAATVSIHLSDPSGRPTRFASLSMTGYHLAVADLDLDGHLDLVAVEATGIATARGRGDGTFQAPRSRRIRFFSGLALGDYNRDGRPDAVLGDATNGLVVLLPGLGNGEFGDPTNLAVGSGVASPVLADLDGDGLLDLGVQRSDAGLTRLYRGTASGTFTPWLDLDAGSGCHTLGVFDAGPGQPSCLLSTGDFVLRILQRE